MFYQLETTTADNENNTIITKFVAKKTTNLFNWEYIVNGIIFTIGVIII